MRNVIRAAAAACLAASLSGCSTVGTDLTNVITWIDQPSTQQAVLTLKTVTTALVCDINAAANLTAQVASEVNAAKVTNNANLVAVGSGTVCKTLGGMLTGATVANATAVTAAAQ